MVNALFYSTKQLKARREAQNVLQISVKEKNREDSYGISCAQSVHGCCGLAHPRKIRGVPIASSIHSSLVQRTKQKPLAFRLEGDIIYWHAGHNKSVMNSAS